MQNTDYGRSGERLEEKQRPRAARLTSASHVRARPLGSWGSHCQIGAAVPLRRRGGHELTGRAVEIQQSLLSTYRRIIRARQMARRAMRQCEKSC